MGSVRSMCRGRRSVTERRNLILAAGVGNEDGGGGMPSFWFRRWMMVFLWVSWTNRRESWAKMAKHMSVHWVQRQPLRTVTNEPITGLSLVNIPSRIVSEKTYPKEGPRNRLKI